jgi:hypothetical protein
MNSVISEAQVLAYHYAHLQHPLSVSHSSFTTTQQRSAVAGPSSYPYAAAFLPAQISPQGGIDPALIHASTQPSASTTPMRTGGSSGLGSSSSASRARPYVNFSFNPARLYLPITSRPQPSLRSAQYPYLTCSSSTASKRADTSTKPRQSPMKASRRINDQDELILPSPYIPNSSAERSTVPTIIPQSTPPSESTTIAETQERAISLNGRAAKPAKSPVRRRKKARMTDSDIHLFHQQLMSSARSVEGTGETSALATRQDSSVSGQGYGGRAAVEKRRKKRSTQSQASPAIAQVFRTQSTGEHSAPDVLSPHPAPVSNSTDSTLDKSVSQRESTTRARSSSASSSSSDVHDVMDLGKKKRRIMISGRDSRASVPREAVGSSSPTNQTIGLPASPSGEAQIPGAVPAPRKPKEARGAGAGKGRVRKEAELGADAGGSVQSRTAASTALSATTSDGREHVMMASRDTEPCDVEVAIHPPPSSARTMVDTQTEERTDSESEIDELLPSSPAPYGYGSDSDSDRSDMEHGNSGQEDDGGIDQLRTPTPYLMSPPRAKLHARPASSSPVARLKAKFKRKRQNDQTNESKEPTSYVTTARQRGDSGHDQITRTSDAQSDHDLTISISTYQNLGVASGPATPMQVAPGSGPVSTKRKIRTRLGPGWVTKTPLAMRKGQKA